ncbi:MAG: D-alanine--D-alanine ligase [Spirochaetae bacterium HGW-Spirochaetae-8]|nr:MAG: D-alanine--D-alanine ligase [Spirochaetae bacterium HGW-Spirochaetae-8]
MNTRKVGLLYGGKSVEQAISIRSATNLYHQMIEAGHQVLAIGIAGDGQWYLQETSDLQESDQLSLCVKAENRLLLLPGIGICTQPEMAKLDLDLCFPITHGNYGEDGRLQGLLEILELPYVGCGPLSSAIGMHKELAKQQAKCCGIPVVPSTSLSNTDYDYLIGTSSNASPMLLRIVSNESEMQNRPLLRSRTALSRLMSHLQDTLGSSILIKPNTGGSSVGVVALKQYNDTSFLEALKEVGRFSETILIELLVTDMVEVECAVLQKDGSLEVTKPGMVVDPLGKDYSFLSYGSKYSDNHSAYMDIPAPIPLECSKTIRQYSRNLCEALDVRGLARVDFFFRPDTRTIFFNEINTLPGMTAQSHYPRLIEAAGYSWPELLDTLFNAAIDEHRKRKQLVYEFDRRI